MISFLYPGVSVQAKSWDHVPIRFQKLVDNTGLSQGVIHDLMQDEKGFIWIATQEGLCRYDAYDLIVYRKTNQTNSLIDNRILSIERKPRGHFWIGTINGLDLFDPISERFTHFQHMFRDEKKMLQLQVLDVLTDTQDVLWIGSQMGLYSLSSDHMVGAPFTQCDAENMCIRGQVNTILEDHDGNLWIGSEAGLSRIDSKRKDISHVLHREKKSSILGIDGVNTIYEDKKALLWFGTSHYICRLNPRKTALDRCYDLKSKQLVTSVQTILEDNRGGLWTGTNAGLLSFNNDTRSFDWRPLQTGKPNKLVAKDVLVLILDKEGDLLAGTKEGIYTIEIGHNPFQNHYHKPPDPTSLSNNMVFSFYEDSRSDLWIGTNGGLNKLDRTGNRFFHYQHKPNDPRSLSHNYVRAIIEDRNKNLWVTTKGGGLNRFDPQSGIFSHFHHQPDNPNSLSHDNLFSIVKDHQDTLWIGAANGLNRFDPNTQRIERFTYRPDDPKSLSEGWVKPLLIDMQKNLWIGTFGGGLNKYVEETNNFEHYKHHEGDSKSLCHNWVLSLFEDRTGTIWVGTRNGLAKFDRNHKTFQCFQEADGLPNGVIYGILQDDQGFLWLSTNYGICRFDPRTGRTNNFTKNDGLQDNEFNIGAYLQDKSHMMYFGGVNGFTRFHPDHVRIDPPNLNVVLTDFQLYDKTCRSGDHNPAISKIVRHGIGYRKQIELRPHQNTFTIEFSSLYFRNPEIVEYAYIMEGLDKDWKTTSYKNRRAFYHDVPDGRYVFRAKASLNNRDWNETRLDIVVMPSWRKSLRVVCIVMLILGGILVLIWLSSRNKKIKSANQPEHTSIPDPTQQLKSAVEIYNLTLTEIHVLECLSRGLSNKEIAQERHISLNTVKTHIKQILYKMKCKSRIQAALFAKNALNNSSHSQQADSGIR